MWRARTGVQISKKKFHTHIYLNYVKIKILSYIKKIYMHIISQIFQTKIFFQTNLERENTKSITNFTA